MVQLDPKQDPFFGLLFRSMEPFLFGLNQTENLEGLDQTREVV